MSAHGGQVRSISIIVRYMWARNKTLLIIVGRSVVQEKHTRPSELLVVRYISQGSDIGVDMTGIVEDFEMHVVVN